MSEDVTIVVGLGEVGRPLYEILRQTYDCVGVDIEPVSVSQPCSVMHICIRYEVTDFLGAASKYYREIQAAVDRDQQHRCPRHNADVGGEQPVAGSLQSRSW